MIGLIDDTVKNHVKASVEVVTLSMHSERGLLQKLAGVSSGLKSHDWNERREAFKRLRELAVGRAKQWECFVDNIRPFPEYIAQAMLDLRSKLAKEACSTVAILAQVIHADPRLHKQDITYLLETPGMGR